MTLRQKQSIFVELVSRLIKDTYDQGYELTFGECYRGPVEAERLAELGLGIRGSLHTQRLAIDLNLFLNGRYLTISKDYEPIGKLWESYSSSIEGIECCWGGRFQNKDGNHFSIKHNGKK